MRAVLVVGRWSSCAVGKDDQLRTVELEKEEKMQIIEVLSAGLGNMTGYDIRRRCGEELSRQGYVPVPIDDALVWLEGQRDVSCTTILDPTVEEAVSMGEGFAPKAMPVLQRGPDGQWNRRHMLLVTYHRGPIAVLAVPCASANWASFTQAILARRSRFPRKTFWAHV